ncbi:MAG TPA: helix-turn-helix domain-containing protein [Candidatus Limnocylindria bacterium]|nr:helix-turn-helix domain-containing protein [Candidatus Limnocylindria bacterium]
MAGRSAAIATGFRIKLTPEQRAELHRRARKRVVPPRLRDRLEMVRLSDLDWSVPKIAAYLGCHEQTVRKSVKAFLAGGFDALPDRPRPGRPPTLTVGHLEAVEQHLDAAAARGETWTAPRLAAWLAETHRVRIDPEYLAARLRQRKFRWKRTKRSVRHKADPDLQARAKADLEVLTF